PARGVEDVHRCGRGTAFPEGVHAAAVQVLALVTPVVARVAADHRHRFPDSLGLVRLDAGSADLVDQQTTGGQGVIADHFAVHAETRTTGKEPVLRVLLPD